MLFFGHQAVCGEDWDVLCVLCFFCFPLEIASFCGIS